MDWPLLYELVSKAVTIPLVATGLGAVLGASIGILGTHWFTQRREREKLLREKAEALILLLYQIRHRLTAWRIAIGQQAVRTTPLPVERPAIILLDLSQVDAFRLLYFPALRDQLTAMEDALRPLVDWLDVQWERLNWNFDGWRAQFDPEEGAPLLKHYTEVVNETIEAVVRGSPLSRVVARPLTRLRRR